MYKASKYGIERLEFFDNEEDANANVSGGRIITLENCVKITPDPQKIQPNVFVVSIIIYDTSKQSWEQRPVFFFLIVMILLSSLDY